MNDTSQMKLFQFYAWNKDRPRCFENFLLTDENTEAFNAAQQAAMQPGEVYSPLYIYGGTCTGKTYLLYAIEDFLHKHSPQLNVLHVTMEEFSNELINAIQERNDADLSDFRSKYRSADVLLVDDVQFLIKKESHMEEFLHTFNALYDAGKQIVITGNHDPEALKQEGLWKRLAARLLFGQAVEIRRRLDTADRTESNAVPEEAAFHLIFDHWSQILDKVRTDYGISDIPWRLWIRPMQPLEMRKRELYIVCGMDIGTTMAERKYSGMIQDAVESMTGIQIDPVFLPPEVQETDSARMKYAVRLEGRCVVLPSPALEVLGTGAVVTKALDGDIALYPMAEWEEMKHRLLSFCAHGNGRKLVRFLLAGAEETTVSRLGVLVIPEHFEDLCRDIMETEIRDTGVILRPVE